MVTFISKNVIKSKMETLKKGNFFKVLPSTLDTPRPTFFTVLELVLEGVLRDGAKVPYRIFFYLLYRPKSATF